MWQEIKGAFRDDPIRMGFATIYVLGLLGVAVSFFALLVLHILTKS